MNEDCFVWIEKFRPIQIKDIILPDKSKRIIKNYIKQKDIPHLIFHTRFPGSGKTSLAKAIANEMDSPTKFINGSKDGAIDTLRNEVSRFASTVGLLSGKKIVIVDEADHITGKFADAMRGVLEEFHNTCSFIFTCNHLERIIEAIRSRCQYLDFNFVGEKEIYNSKIKIYNRLEYILKNENIEFKPEVIVEIINKKYPDIRSMINLLQYEANNEGKIDNSVIDRLNEMDISKLFEYIKDKNFIEARQYIVNNSIFNMDIYRQLYDNLSIYLIGENIPEVILKIAEYEYQSKFGVDLEINVIAMLIELMGLAKFKG